MAIPKYDEIMLPLPKVLSDGREHKKQDLATMMGDHFHLTQEERVQLLPSTRSTYLKNRTGWAGFHLRKAGLAHSPREATLQITDEGRTFLASNPARIDRSVLMQLAPFKQFMLEQKARGAAAARTKAGLAAAPVPAEEDETPEERIDEAFTELRETLVSDLLAKLSTTDPFRFEQVVLDLLVAMGYGGSRREAAAVTQKTGDEGIDGVINEDRLGLDVIYVQAKRWKATVGRPEIQSFVGALAGKKAAKGVFITTSAFHENARDYAEGLHQKVILVDGRRLTELMIEHDIGVAAEHTYSVKKIDSDYFDES
ncbi:MAG: restriction endonuclease [Chthoniobacterales bacterium]